MCTDMYVDMHIYMRIDMLHRTSSTRAREAVSQSPLSRTSRTSRHAHTQAHTHGCTRAHACAHVPARPYLCTRWGVTTKLLCRRLATRWTGLGLRRPSRPRSCMCLPPCCTSATCVRACTCVRVHMPRAHVEWHMYILRAHAPHTHDAPRAHARTHLASCTHARSQAQHTLVCAAWRMHAKAH